MTIEVTVISAEGLRFGINIFVKKDVFVVVRSDPFNRRSTGTDREGGSYPTWNEKLVMELPANARFLTVEARSGSRLIGAANIPVSDFSGGVLPMNHLSYFELQVEGCEWQEEWMVNLSVRVMSPGPGEPWPGFPMVGGKAVARGTPVSYKY